jgi:hypothetical protein
LSDLTSQHQLKPSTTSTSISSSTSPTDLGT